MADLAPLVETPYPVLNAPIQGRPAPAPYSFEFTGEDSLRLTIYNAKVGVRVAVHYRVHTATNPTHASAFKFTPTSDRLATTTEFGIGEGYLLNATVFADAGAPLPGQTYIKLQAIRGRSAAATVLGTILQGYVTAGVDLGWPGSPLMSNLEAVAPRLISGTTPTAGNEISETVPVGARWELLTIDALLTTSAIAGNRRPSVIMDDGAGNPICRSPHGTTLAASLSKTFYWMAGMPHDQLITADAGTAGLPVGVTLLAGHRVRTNTESFAAGDLYGTPYLTVREYLEI